MRVAGQVQVLVVGAVLLVAAAVPAGAQPPHYNRIPSMQRVRAEFLYNVRTAITETVEDLKAAVQRSDTAAAVKLFVEGAMYSSSDGLNHYGEDGIREGFGARLAEVGGLALTVLDFSASGSLAFQYGRYTYAARRGGNGYQEGTYVLVMEQAGRDWKIRSLVERRDDTP